MSKSIAVLGIILSLLLLAVAVAGIHGKSFNIYDYDATESEIVAGF